MLEETTQHQALELAFVVLKTNSLTLFIMYKPTNKTIILGSGVNNLLFQAEHFFCTWNNFTKHFFNAVSHDHSPATLLMEACIRQNELGIKHSKSANDIELLILQNIANEIENESHVQCKQSFDWIFENKSVTDIICLNFNFPFGLEKEDFRPEKDFISSKKSRENFNNYQCWTAAKARNHEIRFWFPHGSILYPKFIVFGAFRYMKQTEYIKNLFEKLKKRERNIITEIAKDTIEYNERVNSNFNSTEEEMSWLIPFFYNEVYVLGSSLSMNEWDIWSALTLRIRNFAKLENRKYEHPIFHMRRGTQNDTSYPTFIQPLYDPSMSYDDQWKKLEQDFRKEINTQRSQSKKNNKRPR